MTDSAITRPGERDRLTVKLGEIDWLLCAILAAIALVGTLMLYSIAGRSWNPWADRHLALFGVCFVAMIALAVMDLRVWFALAYPVYAAGLALLLAAAVIGHTHLGAQRWLDLGPVHVQPSEIIKIGLVLALARFYHSLPGRLAGLSWWLWNTTSQSLAIGVGLVIGGAIGNNLIDRVVYGRVADFFHFYAFGYDWYVFNVADIAITLGAVAIIYEVLKPEHPHPT